MQLRNLLVTEGCQMLSKKLWQPAILTSLVIAFYSYDAIAYLGFGRPYKAYAIDSYSLINTFSYIILFAFSAVIFLGANATSKHLHRLRLDGISKLDWLAAVNLQAAYTAIIYMASYSLAMLVCMGLSFFGFTFFNNLSTTNYFISNFLHFTLSIYLYSLLAIYIALFVDARLVSVVIVATVYGLVYAGMYFKVIDDSIFYAPGMWVFPTTPNVLPKIVISKSIFIMVLNALLYYKSNFLTRYTTA